MHDPLTIILIVLVFAAYLFKTLSTKMLGQYFFGFIGMVAVIALYWLGYQSQLAIINLKESATFRPSSLSIALPLLVVYAARAVALPIAKVRAGRIILGQRISSTLYIVYLLTLLIPLASILLVDWSAMSAEGYFVSSSLVLGGFLIAAIFTLIYQSRRYEIRDKGILDSGTLRSWSTVQSYAWGNIDKNNSAIALIVNGKRSVSRYWSLTLWVSIERREELEALLKNRVPQLQTS